MHSTAPELGVARRWSYLGLNARVNSSSLWIRFVEKNAYVTQDRSSTDAKNDALGMRESILARILRTLPRTCRIRQLQHRIINKSPL